MFNDFFFEFLTPLLWGSVSFLILFRLFFTIVSALDVSIGGAQVWLKFRLDTRHHRALPLDPTCPERLSVRSLACLPYLT